MQFAYTGDAPTTRPLVTWRAGDTYYKDTGAQPDKVYEGVTPVNFSVRFFNANASGDSGGPPTTHEVQIDLNGNGTYEANEVKTMQLVTGNGIFSDGDYSNGEDYTLTENIVSNGADLKYSFLFTIGEGTSAVEAKGTPSMANVITALQSKSDSGNNLCFISSLRLW